MSCAHSTFILTWRYTIYLLLYVGALLGLVDLMYCFIEQTCRNLSVCPKLIANGCSTSSLGYLIKV